ARGHLHVAFGSRVPASREQFHGRSQMSGSEARPSATLRAGCALLGLALLAVGLFFVVGGAKLVSLHGSAYFLIAGVVIAVSAVQFFRAKSSAVVIYGAAFIGTLI